MWNRSLTLLLVLFLPLLACGGEPTATETSAPAESSPSPAAVVDPASALLTDAAAAWKVDFTHRAGAGGELLFPEMMGGGVAVFDAESDGDLDLYFISGAEKNRLYLQGEDGTFADATEGSGLGDEGYGTGVAIGDVNNDGNEDVFVANIGADQLFYGRGDGTFEAAGAKAGLTVEQDPSLDWSTSAAFCDIDRDGYLDLYVVRYVIYTEGVECTDKAGRREYCGPSSFESRTDVLYLNRGDGTFRDITASAGIDVVTGAGLGVVCEDIDEDGFVDIYVANDGDPNQLWVNQGDRTFVDDALILGTSVNAAGLFEAGMGVVAADFDNDADSDLFLTHLRDETNTFYRNLGPGIGFEDHSAQVGLAFVSAPYTGFGTAPFDIDNDGDLDLAVANGRVKRGDPLTDTLPDPWNLYAEPNLFFINDGETFRLEDAAAVAFTASIDVSRGLATGDLDGDGDLDLVVSNIESPARLFQAEASGHWLLIDAFDPRLGRRALGARVVVEAGGKSQARTIQGAMSYLSSADPRAHFGFGETTKIEAVRVRWPDGLEETFTEVGIDQAIVLRRGEGAS